MGNYDPCKLNLRKNQHQLLLVWEASERRSESEMARLLLDIGYCVATGNIEKAERIAGRLHTQAPEYHPDTDPGEM